MASQSDTPVVEDTVSQLARLQAQVEELMRDRVGPAVADMTGRAEAAFGQAKGIMCDQTENVAAQVRKQPLVAVGVAIAIGWVLGRLTR